jgi:formylglycine-generating enzyme required for sulfatase activity
MKKIFKVKAIQRIVGIIAIVAIIGFSFAACEEKEDNPPPPPVISVSLNKDSLFLFKDDQETLTATVTNTSNTAVSWSSSDTTKVTVADGVVTAVAIGTATITATTVDGGKTATCTVTVIIEQIEMVSIPAGTFTMGSPTTEANRISNETQHSVTLSGFKMGKYQVTQEQYQAIMGTNPSNFNGSTGNEPATGETQGKRPVECVTWYDAVEFCNKLSAQESLQSVYTISGRTPASGYPITSATVTADFTKNGYRLPTEAQWEYACRAGTTTAWNTGNTFSDNTGWYYSNSGSKTHEVGKKPANAWGLHDMHGNVVEWCWDWYGSSYYSSSPTNDPMGASSGTSRVERGGYYNIFAAELRSAYRDYDRPNFRYDFIGFRLVRP